MGLWEKAVDFWKTSMGKFVVALIAITLVLVCSTLAYGTGEDDTLPLADTDGAPAEEVQPAEGDDPEGSPEVTEGEDAVGDETASEEDAAVEPVTEGEEDLAEGEEGTEEELQDEPVEPGKTRIAFLGLDEAPVTVQGLERSTFDIPEGNEGQALEFILLPDVCNTITAAQATITAAVEAPVAVAASEPAANEAVSAGPAEGAPEETVTPEVPAATEGAIEEKELTLEDPAKDILKETPYAKKLTISAADLEGAAEVAITIQTEERDMVWFDIMQAFDEGEDITLEGDVAVDALTLGDMTIEAAPAVVDGKVVTLDLNGHTIANVNDVSLDAFFMVKNGGSLTIADPNEGLAFTPKTIGAADAQSAGREGSCSVSKDGASVTYYETRTVSKDSFNAVTSEVLVERTVTIPATVGAVVGNNIGSLVSVEGGSALAVTGGRLTNAGSAEGKGHGVVANGSTVSIEGGAIVGCTLVGGNGAGISANGSTVNLQGSAVVGGNSVRFTGAENSGNGGGIYAASSVVNVTGSAVVAANTATEVDMGDPWSGGGNRPVNQNGGGVYLTSSQAIIDGNALIASNRAKHDGGGLYGATTAQADSITLAGNANITNNRTTKEITKNSADVRANWATIGGGGICSSGRVVINGGSVNGNYSSDAGGGLLMPQLNHTVTATLNMNDGVVACNYAATDEGGGMYLFTTGYEGGEKSYINAGFITNNVTATEFGYGGGGLFIANASPNHGYVNVVNPLVTGNTAEGQGGGIAGCKNGMMVTNAAAIFRNTAHEGKSTSHEVGIGDNWGFAISEKLNEGAENKVTYSNDYYNAGESTVYANMLGGGASNWTGYMNYESPWLRAEDGGWNKAKTLSTRGTLSLDGSNLNGLANKALLGDAIPADVYRITLKNVNESDVKAFADSLRAGVFVELHRTDAKWFAFEGFAGLVTDLEKDESGRPVGNKGYSVEDGGFYHIFLKKISDDKVASVAKDENGKVYGGYVSNDADQKITDGLEYGTTYYLEETIWGTSQKRSGNYTIAKITDFPEEHEVDPAKAVARAYAGRIMALTADPAEKDENTARSLSKLCIGFNHSNTNGGGIACNGFTHIGRWMPDTPQPEDPEPDPKAKLNITKSFTNGFDAEAGTATVIFNIAGYISEDWDRSDPAYENTITMTFDPNESMAAQTYTLPEEFDANMYFVIQEVAFAGSNYTGQATWEGTLRDAGKLAPGDLYQVIAAFENTFSDEDIFGTGAVNRYTEQDGTYTYQEKISTSTWSSQSSTDNQ